MEVNWLFTVLGGFILLGIGIAYGLYQYNRRNRSQDARTEEATRAMYEGRPQADLDRGRRAH